jgi:RNA polymerase sigma-70 factor, ECF subfamily
VVLAMAVQIPDIARAPAPDSPPARNADAGRASIGRDLPPDAPTVAALVIAAQRGERTAYAALYDRFAGAVHAALLSRVAYADVRDLVQDVFLIGLDRLPSLREPAAFGGWILAIARNRATDHHRRDRTGEPGGAGGGDVEAIGQDAPPRAEALEVLSAIRALPEAYRETLMMRLVEGMTGPEIADRTGLTPESVRVNLCRGMKLLRDRLEGEVTP